MPPTHKIFAEVLKEIKPSKKEDAWVKDQVQLFLNHLVERINQLQVSAEAMLGGSIAKDTYLKEKHDADFFVRFDPGKYSNEQLPGLLEKILEPLSPERVHGSRDYFNLRSPQYGNLFFEIVPVFWVDNHREAVNVTDMSPLHVAWAQQKILQNPGVNDEIRLAKQFCKANRVYGAESYIKGMSGHVLDILVIYYGSFEELLKNAVNWNKNQVVDVEDFYHGKFPGLNKAKVSPLIVIDPIDPERNAAAALSATVFNKFKDLCSQFIENPARQFFVKEDVGKEIIVRKHEPTEGKLLVLKLTGLEGKDDVVGSKALKIYKYFKKNLAEFKVLDSDFYWDKSGRQALVWYKLGKANLPEKFVKKGPPLKKTSNGEDFKRKHPNVWEEGGVLFAEVNRKFTEPVGLIKKLCESDYVKDKIKSIEVVYQ